MDLRIVRFRAWQLGVIAEPPPCQQQDGRGTAGCWCFKEPAATRQADGKIRARPCPTNPSDHPPPITVIVGQDDC